MTEEINWSAPNPQDAPQAASFGTASHGEVMATFGLRLLGRILDGLNNVVASIGVALLSALTLTMSGAEEGSATATIVTLVGYGVLIGLQIMWEGNGGSPFRRGIGVLIVDQNTFQPIGPWRAIVRILVSVISALSFGLGFLWMLWDKNSQTWHDKAAGSVVVKR
jgi:serine/threonine-protein kinase